MYLKVGLPIFQAYLALEKMKFKALVLQIHTSACKDHEMMQAVELLMHKS